VDGGNPAGSATVVLPAGQIHFFMEIATTYGSVDCRSAAGIGQALQELVLPAGQIHFFKNAARKTLWNSSEEVKNQNFTVSFK
jgi:hypothetical protein